MFIKSLPCHRGLPTAPGTSPGDVVDVSVWAECWWWPCHGGVGNTASLGWMGIKRAAPAKADRWVWRWMKAGRRDQRGRLLLCSSLFCVLQLDAWTGTWPVHGKLLYSASSKTQPERWQRSTRQTRQLQPVPCHNLAGSWKFPTAMGKERFPTFFLGGQGRARPYMSSWHEP